MHLRRMQPMGSKRRGGALFWLLLCLGTILGFVALVMDSGRLMEQRRRAQAGADAAVLAAALKLYEAYPQSGASAVRAAGLATAADNGFANDGASSVVTVNTPPKTGPYAGKTDCVEVVIESTLPASFGKIVTGDEMVVRARAVARG